MKKTKEITEYLTFMIKVKVLKFLKHVKTRKKPTKFLDLKRVLFISGWNLLKKKVKKI